MYAVPPAVNVPSAIPAEWPPGTRVVTETRPPCSTLAVVNDGPATLQILQTVDLCEHAPVDCVRRRHHQRVRLGRRAARGRGGGPVEPVAVQDRVQLGNSSEAGIMLEARPS
mmetsp:Transcript_13461/g.41875  ORF Transcript_13461/g.41875 Transcript_13461/m.41875 type:complete len:112 (+) Transcript_13461:373-708(+)